MEELNINLTKKQKAFLLYCMENPFASIKEAAEAVGISPNTVYNNWRWSNPQFKQLMDEVLNEAWSIAKHNASNKLFELVDEGDFKAITYVLDFNGYGGTQKIAATVDNTIHIGLEDD